MLTVGFYSYITAIRRRNCLQNNESEIFLVDRPKLRPEFVHRWIFCKQIVSLLSRYLEYAILHVVFGVLLNVITAVDYAQ